MKCPKCHSENGDTQRYCGECGTPLDRSVDVQVSHTRTLETPLEELSTGSLFAGRYQIIEELGHGGMGRVYRTLDKKINEEVALKLIRPEIASEKRTLERFGNELKIARKIAHKNVGKMYHLSEEKGTHYITMEYVPGEDLKRMIRMSKHLSVDTAVDIGKQICEGLAEAHRLGIVHRDLKPSNIMIDREGNARIMDFGIARLMTAKGITGAGVAVGTPDYMSPEQVEGKEADSRSDIYSLGIILYEMVTGRVPFEAETPYALGYKHKNETPVSPKALNPQVPDDLNALILKCLEKEPSKRFQTSDELGAGLEKVEKGLPTTTKLTPIPKRTSLTSREITIKFTARRLIVPGLALIAIVAAIILAVLFLPHRAPQAKASPVHKQITFTGAASFPAISPDGKFIAYTDKISGNEQKVVIQDLTGGQTIEVFRGRECVGLRWSPDGSELSFCTETSTDRFSAWIVPRLGGKARELSGIYYSVWSPDGSQFASWSDEKKELSFTNKTTGESKSISFDESFPAYGTDLDWSPSGKFILLSMYDDNDVPSIWTVSADGRQKNKIIEDPEKWLGSSRWSPRGDAIYYVREQEPTSDIWKIPISPETGRPSRAGFPVFEGHQIGYYFTLTNDAKKLAYTREVEHSNLWLITVEGSGNDQKVDIKQLTAGTQLSMAPNFSPDGKLIVYGRGSNTMEIFVMPTGGGPSQQLTFMNSWNYCPVWSPDGTEIAFASSSGDLIRIWKVSASGGTPRQFAKADGSFPVWAPGPKILFQAYNGTSLMLLDQAAGDAASIFKTDKTGGMLYPAWSPEGKRVVFRVKGGADDVPSLRLLNLEDSSDVLLYKGSALPIAWSPDGKLIYAWELISGGGRVLTISPEVGRTDVLFTLPMGPEIGYVVFRPHTVDGKHFVFEGRTTQADIWLIENFDPEVK